MDSPQNYMASRWKRLAGAMCDSLISIAVLLPVIWATGAFRDISEIEQMSFAHRFMFFLAGWIVFIAVHGYLLATQGQTIGKRIVGTRIVGLDGKIPSLSRLLCFRYMIFGLVGQVPGVGAIVQLTNVLLIFGKEKRCMHDIVAGTLVIDSSIPVTTLDAENAWSTP